MRIRQVSSMSNNNYAMTWDPSKLQLTTSFSRPTAVRASCPRPSRDYFIKGPVNIAWLSRARALGVTALWVGLIIWHLRGMRGSDTIVLSNKKTRELNVLPDAKSRALRKLEK